jgi:hypothetical protein
MLEQIKSLRASGLSPAQIAVQLNGQGLKTARGRPWAEHSVVYQLGKSRSPKAATQQKPTPKKMTTRVENASSAKTGALATAGAKRVQATKVAARKSDFSQGVKLSKGLEMVIDVLKSTDLGVLKRAQIANELLTGFINA